MTGPRYTRITKRHARERWEAGLPIRLCPCKFMPGGGFALDMLVQPEALRNAGITAMHDASFDAKVQEFCSYNANSNETGYYASYWVTDDMPAEPLQMVVRQKVRDARRKGKA